MTGWGDNGGEASQFSSFASVLYFAERCYKNSADVTDTWLNRRAWECMSISFDDLMAFDLPDSLPEVSVNVIDTPKSPAKTLFYNDLLERFVDRHMNRDNVTKEYTNRSEKLMQLSKDPNWGYAFETLAKLCYAISLKAEMGWRLYEAYHADDKKTLKRIATEEIPLLSKALKSFLETYRRQWYQENKTFGFIQQEIRIGGQITRVESVGLRIRAYVDGEVQNIEELEFAPIPYNPELDGQYLGKEKWHKLVSAGIF